jgi:hypothetical protein
LPALENFGFLAQRSESLYSILFAADDFCSERFLSVLLRLAKESDLDGVDRVLWVRLIAGNKVELQKDLSQFRFKATFGDLTKQY